jgi:AraC-like DNA-binding protein
MELTEEEAFYRRYHIAKNNPEQFRQFLSDLDIDALRSHKYVIPEIRERLNLNFADEQWVWDSIDKDICIHKHPRYMPEWDFVHNFYEIIYVYRGRYSLYISDQIVEMCTGYVCIIPPGVCHRTFICDDSISLNTKLRKSSFQTSFSPLFSENDTLSKFFLNTMYIGDYADYVLFRSENDEQLRKLFSAIYLEHYNKEAAYSKVMNNLLSIVFSLLARHYKDEMDILVAKSGRLRKIEAILAYVHSNYRVITLRDLAKKFYFSEQYLSEFIRKNTGRNFVDIVREVRLETAKKLLETTDLTVAHIGETSGYASAEHFMRQFKKQYGISPSGYRCKNKDGGTEP